MSSHQGQKKPLSPRVWVGIFWGLLILLASGFYTLTVHFDYTWSWYKIPGYFVFQQKQRLVSEIDGTVLINKSPHVEVVVQGDNSRQFRIPASQATVVVSAGDFVFTGDTLAFKTRWQFGPFLTGLWVTLKLSVLASLLAFLLGILTGVARLSANPVLKWFSLIYIEVVRGTPLLVQLFIIYFMVGSVIGIDDRFVCGVLSLALFAGAYIGEIIRGGVASIHYGQMEAAQSLGMNYLQSMIWVIIPQVLRRTLPAIAGTFISLVKDSSLVSVMALTDLTKAGREVVSSTFMVFETWLTVAALYFLITMLLSLLVKKLERRLALGEVR